MVITRAKEDGGGGRKWIKLSVTVGGIIQGPYYYFLVVIGGGSNGYDDTGRLCVGFDDDDDDDDDDGGGGGNSRDGTTVVVSLTFLPVASYPSPFPALPELSPSPCQQGWPDDDDDDDDDDEGVVVVDRVRTRKGHELASLHADDKGVIIIIIHTTTIIITIIIIIHIITYPLIEEGTGISILSPTTFIIIMIGSSIKAHSQYPS